MRKIRYIIKVSECSLTIIYTNYSTTILIFKQINLTISNINKLNLQLMKASQYLFNFNIVMKHKFDKSNIVFNALFRF